MRDLAAALAELGIADAFELFEPHWEESEASYPEGGPPFVQPGQVAEHHAFAALPAELEPLLQETARRIRETPALSHLAWHCHRLLFEYRDYEGPSVAKWPPLTAALGELQGLFYLLVAMGMIPLVKAVHRSRGIPEQVTRETCGHFPSILQLYREAHGGWGVPLNVLYWLRHYTAGDLFTLGRLQYMVRPFSGRLEAYRHVRTGEVVALAADGTRFAADGCIVSDAAPDGPGAWTAKLEHGQDAVTGRPISPAGVGMNAQVTLPHDQWRRVLATGDPVLDTHIPGGGGLTPERCHDTMRRALEFFPRYFPERPFVGFGCGSWILNPELEWIYSPTSNMVLWQRELYLFPIPSGPRSGLFFVFGRDDVDSATAPRDTSLRRALLEQLERGGRLIGGGMFFLKDDFEHFGTQFYRSHWPPSALAEQLGAQTRCTTCPQRK